MTEFQVFPTLIGGGLFGAAAGLLLLLTGRTAGFSGILAGLVTGRADWRWRLALVTGVLAAATVGAWIDPGTIATASNRSLAVVGLAGLLVGFGTRLGGGCTSGHGVCGIGRRSSRSAVATLVFGLTAFATAVLFAVLTGGQG